MATTDEIGEILGRLERRVARLEAGIARAVDDRRWVEARVLFAGEHEVEPVEHDAWIRPDRTGYDLLRGLPPDAERRLAALLRSRQERGFWGRRAPAVAEGPNDALRPGDRPERALLDGPPGPARTREITRILAAKKSA